MSAFSKIAATPKAVALRWTTTEGHAEISHELESDEPPRPEFVQALDAFVPHVLSICELTEEWAEDMAVTSLSISKNAKSGRRGLVITARRSVEQTNAPLLLHTPILFETVEDEDLGGDAAFPLQGIDEALAAVEAEASAYLGGARAQLEMFEAPKPALEVPVGNGGQPGDRSVARKRGKAKKAAEPDYEIVDDGGAPVPRLDEKGIGELKQSALSGV